MRAECISSDLLFPTTLETRPLSSHQITDLKNRALQDAQMGTQRPSPQPPMSCTSYKLSHWLHNQLRRKPVTTIQNLSHAAKVILRGFILIQAYFEKQ